MLLKIILSVVFAKTLYASEHGLFMIVEGKVLIQNTTEIKEAKVNSKILIGETVITDLNSRAKIVMSDRNVINIAANTKLKIEKYTNTKEDKNVVLTLTQGSVRNDVEQVYNEAESNFEVHTPVAVIGVRGTQFITTYNQSEKTAEVTTLKGQVKFRRRLKENSKQFAESVIIEKGHRSIIRNGFAPNKPQRLKDSDFKKLDLESTIQAKKEIKNANLQNKNMLKEKRIERRKNRTQRR